MFACPLCTKTFQNGQILNKHIFSHTKEKPHKCPTCSATFSRVGTLTNHIEKVHKSITNKSDKCPADFYNCKSDGCNYKTINKCNLDRHLKIHNNDRPFACEFSGCNYTCKTKDYLQTHLKYVHSDSKRWKCSSCDFRTKHKSYLSKHHQVVHSGTKHFKCQASNCRYSCNHKMDLINHFDRKHRRKELSCTEPRCKYRCSTTALLKRQVKKHKLRVLKCPSVSCAYSTRLKYNLNIHISRYHGDNHSASQCNSKKPARIHVISDELVETRRCPFPNCDYQTDFPHRYDRHILFHGQEKQRKYACKLCSSRFTTPSLLENHIRRHVGEKPHSCLHCNYTAIDGKNLRYHAKRAHHIFVFPRWGEHRYERKCRTCNMTFSSYSEFVLHSMTHLKPVVVLERLRIQVM